MKRISPAVRALALWTLGFLSFPVAGIAGAALVGRVDDPLAALIGGAVAGAVVGAGQVIVSTRRLTPRRWIPATAVGLGVGLLLGASSVGFNTELPDLMLMGALTGIPLGIAQAAVLPAGTRRRWVWAASMPALMALGWTVTTIAGVNVSLQFTNFGALGAIAFAGLSGLVLQQLLPVQVRQSADAAAAQ